MYTWVCYTLLYINFYIDFFYIYLFSAIDIYVGSNIVLIYGVAFIVFEFKYVLGQI